MTVVTGLLLSVGVVVVMFGFFIASPAGLTFFESWVLASAASTALLLLIAFLQSLRRA